jgi:hypothetical protein
MMKYLRCILISAPYGNTFMIFFSDSTIWKIEQLSYHQRDHYKSASRKFSENILQVKVIQKCLKKSQKKELKILI